MFWEWQRQTLLVHVLICNAVYAIYFVGGMLEYTREARE